MKTSFISEKEIDRQWYLIDAKDQILGRVATQIASVLMGKNKPIFSANQDTGSNVVVINSADVKLTGKKEEQKTYFSASSYPGNSKTTSYAKAMAKDGTFPVIHAVRGMLPKNARGRAIFRKLHVYAGPDHNQQAQSPEPIAK